MKFETTKEMAKAVLEHGEMFNGEGGRIWWQGCSASFEYWGIKWKEVLSFDWSPDEPLKDKDFCEFWDGYFYRVLGFYDADNKCIFATNGKRGGSCWRNIKKVKGELPDWVKEARKKLVD